VVPEIDDWRAAQLRLKRDSGRALDESAARADEFALPMIRTARRHGVGSRMLSFSSLTRPHPARCTDRRSGFIGTAVARCADARAAAANAGLAQPHAAVGDREHWALLGVLSLLLTR
jgi:hypothetical protein